MMIANHIRDVCAAGGDGYAIEQDSNQISWNALSRAVEEFSLLLEQNGVPIRAPIGLLGRNRLSLIAGFIAILGAGRPAVLVNVSRSSKLVAEELTELNLACAVGESADLSQDVVDAAKASGTMLVSPELADGELAFAVHTPMQDRPFREAGDDILFEIQTSGTTGKPKRIEIKESTMSASLKDGVRNAKGTVDQKVLKVKGSPTFLIAPIVHTSGAFSVLMSLFEVRPIVLFEKFNVDDYLNALSRHTVRFASFPPTVIKMFVDSAATREDLSSLIAVRSGTAPLSVSLQEEFEQKFGVPVLTNYGATEFMGVAASWTLEDYKKFGADKRGSVGRAPKGVALRVVDAETGETVGPGEQGILEVRLDRLDGGKEWNRTTDLASLDADGFLFIHGRADDAIIRGGFKILAGKIADAIKQYPGVLDAIVLGLPDERLGQVPVAVVELYKDAPDISADDLRAFAKEKLTAYEVPARIHVVDKLPRTVSQKVSRPETIALVEELEN